MKFDEILSRWEEEQRHKAKKEARCQEEKKDREMNDWLEMYPPDRNMKHRKEIPDRIIIHTRKKEMARMEPQDTLDLHGWTGQDAVKELDRFLKSAKRRGLIKVQVIHGKGLHSPDGKSVLKPLVKKYLEGASIVRDYGKAKGRAGGGGATWILLR